VLPIIIIIIIAKGHGFRDIPWRKIEWGGGVYFSLPQGVKTACLVPACKPCLDSF